MSTSVLPKSTHPLSVWDTCFCGVIQVVSEAMDLQAALGLADRVLNDPLRSEIKGLFSGLQASSVLPRLGDRTTCVGHVLEVGSDWISVAAFPFARIRCKTLELQDAQVEGASK